MAAVLATLLALLVALGAGLAAPAAAQTADEDHAVVHFDGEALFEVRGISALPAAQRAGLVRERLRSAAEDPRFDPDAIAVTPIEDGFRIGTPEHLLVNIYAADARLEDIETGVLATTVEARVQAAIRLYRETRTPRAIRGALVRSAAWTAAYVAGLFALVHLSRWRSRRLEAMAARRVAEWERRSRNVLQLTRAWAILNRAIGGAFVLVGLFATYLWLTAVLLALPWTRDLGSAVAAAITGPVLRILRGIASAAPDLVTLALIVVIAVAAMRALGRFFDLVARGDLRLRNFEPEWAAPTERILRVVLILFTAILCYPYIPGSSSEAFKAVGVFAGVILSLGATSIVANLIAGQTLIYRRAFRVGDRIEVAGVTGDVEELTAQATYLRTPKNERVTLPNALVLASQVTNYTQYAAGRGLILHTEVGIGYETPWREVEAMLLDAARRTPGTLAEPAPFVLQTRLGDYSPVYELNVHVLDPRAMPATYSSLHAAIQDVFAEHGVQIMTPSYVADPPDAKVPPRASPAGA